MLFLDLARVFFRPQVDRAQSVARAAQPDKVSIQLRGLRKLGRVHCKFVQQRRRRAVKRFGNARGGAVGHGLCSLALRLGAGAGFAGISAGGLGGAVGCGSGTGGGLARFQRIFRGGGAGLGAGNLVLQGGARLCQLRRRIPHLGQPPFRLVAASG